MSKITSTQWNVAEILMGMERDDAREIADRLVDLIETRERQIQQATVAAACRLLKAENFANVADILWEAHTNGALSLDT